MQDRNAGKNIAAALYLSNIELADKSKMPLLQFLVNEYTTQQDSLEKSYYLELIESACEEKGLTVEELGGANNKNIKITDKEDISVVVQIGKRRLAVVEAINLLSDNGRPEWLANSYADVFYKGEINSNWFAFADRMGDNETNPFKADYAPYLSVLEACPESLDGKVDEIHSNNENPINLAQKVGLQVSRMLGKLSECGVMWTDLKAGNLLMGENGNIVIADTKAFRPASMMLQNEYKGVVSIDYDGCVTPTEISEHMSQIMMENSSCTRDEVQALWEKEYSYQVGKMLHFVMTNEEYLAPMGGEPYPPFDFFP